MAQADVCAAAGGRHFSVGGCTNVAGDAAAVAIASQDYPYVPNEIPCYTVQGTPYYTPPRRPLLKPFPGCRGRPHLARLLGGRPFHRMWAWVKAEVSV